MLFLHFNDIVMTVALRTAYVYKADDGVLDSGRVSARTRDRVLSV